MTCLPTWTTSFGPERAIKAFVAGCTFEDYSSDELLRSGVERKLEIIGESLNRIKRDEPELLQQISKHRDIISLEKHPCPRL